MTPEEQELLALERIGVEAKKFEESEIGRYLKGVADQDENEAKDALLALNVWQFQTLSELQNAIASIQQKARLHGIVRQYLFEAISNGEQASYQLSPGED